MDDRDDNDEPDEEPNYPTVYVDGTALTDENAGDPDLERVQIEFDATANGMQTEAQERAPLGWLNSATIHLDREDDACHVLISCGDPRGAFAMTIRRLDNGNLVMHVPYPRDSMLHMPLAEHHEGTYKVGYWPKQVYFDPDASLRDGKGWTVDDGGAVVVRYATEDEARQA